MGDRSTIALLKTDGTVESVFTYWNGFISGNGALLYQYHNSIELVEDLIKLGDIYNLTDIIEPPIGTTHTIEKPINGVSLFYSRDGTEKVTTKKYDSLEKYLNCDDFQGYNYIFYEKKKQWYLIDNDTKKLEKLSKHLMQDEEVSEHIKKMIKNEKLKNKLEKKLSPKDYQIKVKTNKI